ncbi:uncharacterized protein QC763_0108170 [Podospora pseudopauciseta]|uniref:Uncharacterized protein n=2 Tax=Podospora TaxID=5144 RepID=A0ABR0H1N2_9PEZI|nr:hypothetical protein QC763_0108170 [Podospora pseudopauciseta]KAK4668631.1 hypothetical protein QC764_0104180 [Podospora pseudoanserina]
MADVVIFLYAIGSRKLRFQLSIAPRSTARRKKFSHHTTPFPPPPPPSTTFFLYQPRKFQSFFRP